MADAFSIVILIIAMLGVVAVLWAIRTGPEDRNREDRAREFFHEHGRWPDESPEAVARRHQLEQQAPPPVAIPDEHGRV